MFRHTESGKFYSYVEEMHDGIHRFIQVDKYNIPISTNRVFFKEFKGLEKWEALKKCY